MYIKDLLCCFGQIEVPKKETALYVKTRGAHSLQETKKPDALPRYGPVSWKWKLAVWNFQNFIVWETLLFSYFWSICMFTPVNTFFSWIFLEHKISLLNRVRGVFTLKVSGIISVLTFVHHMGPTLCIPSASIDPGRVPRGGTQYILEWGGAARPLKPWPCLRQKLSEFWYPV